MITEAKILANRLNAQKSTGPKTPEGKAVVAQNALKHSLSARHDVITTESQADFDLHRDNLLAELDPQTPMESMLADRIVSLSWRLKRADLIQNQTIDVFTEKDATNPLAKIANSLGLKGLGLLQPDPADSNPDIILGRIALKDFSNERVLDRLLMYERRIEHSLFKTMLELQRLRLLRTLEPPHSQQDLPPVFAPGSPLKSPENQIPPPIRSEPIINNQSSIVNIESPPEPAQTITQYPASRITPALCKTNPIPKSRKSPQHLVPQRLTPISHPSWTQKNKPNQTQFHQRNTHNAIRKSNPTCPGVALCEAESPTSKTTNDIRHTTYEHSSPMDTRTESSYNAP